MDPIKPKSNKQMQRELLEKQNRIADAQLAAATMLVEKTEDEVAQYKAQKAAKKRSNEQRQGQLKELIRENTRRKNVCEHMQGGSGPQMMSDQEDVQSALNVANMPDGFTKVIMCSVCPLRVFTPHPERGRKTPQTIPVWEGGVLVKKMETKEEAKARVVKYTEDLAEFKVLLKLARKKRTREAAQEMGCGTTFEVRNGEGVIVLPQRPCDTYVGNEAGVGVCAL